MRVIAAEAHGRRLRAAAWIDDAAATARVRPRFSRDLAARTALTEARVLDLFAGSGSLGLEALSRCARGRFFVDFLARGGDRDPDHLACTRPGGGRALH